MGADYYETLYKDRVLRNIAKRARDLGYELTLQPLVREGAAYELRLDSQAGF